MGTYYFYHRAMLHLCNKLLNCSENDYQKLLNKDKLPMERTELIRLLQKYRALTLKMIRILTQRGEEELVKDLDALSEYGLIIKQFYVCQDEEEEVRGETFYCAAEKLPRGLVVPDKKNDFCWTKDLYIADAMAILSFNQFHIALTGNVPQKNLQSQLQFKVKDVTADGHYRLKGKKFHLGYSHVFVKAVRDFGKQNASVVPYLLEIAENYRYGMEKMPWFIFLCENKVQCACLNRKIKAEAEVRDLSVYYILDTDYEFDENPLHMLQTFRFTNEGKEIKSEIFKVEEWF